MRGDRHERLGWYYRLANNQPTGGVALFQISRSLFIYLAYFQGPKALQEGEVNNKCLHSKRKNTVIISKQKKLTKGFINGSLEADSVGDGGNGSGKVVLFFASLRNEIFAVGY